MDYNNLIYVTFLLVWLAGVVTLSKFIWGLWLEEKYVFEMLQHALHDIIRHMENTTRNMPGDLGQKRDNTVKSYLEALAAPISTSTPLVVGGDWPSGGGDSAEIAFKLIGMNENSASAHWFEANGLRTGMQAFVHIVLNQNMQAAFTSMVELMRRQRDEYKFRETMKTNNFTSLKLVLGLPIGWPLNNEPELLLVKGLSRRRESILMTVMKRRRTLLFKNAVHKKWPGSDKGQTERLTFEGEAVIEAIRDYVR